MFRTQNAQRMRFKNNQLTGEISCSVKDLTDNSDFRFS